MDKFATVEQFLDSLDGDKRAQVDQLRAPILAADSRLTEHIKWNAPSYVLDGEDRITFNLMNKAGVVMLVLHMGASRKEDRKAPPVMVDSSGLVTWVSDIRGTIAFASADAIGAQRPALQRVLGDWLAIPAR
jgi:hypothetical protein